MTIWVNSVSVGAADRLLQERGYLQTQGYGHAKGFRCSDTRSKVQFTEGCGHVIRFLLLLLAHRQTNEKTSVLNMHCFGCDTFNEG